MTPKRMARAHSPMSQLVEKSVHSKGCRSPAMSQGIIRVVHGGVILIGMSKGDDEMSDFVRHGVEDLRADASHDINAVR